MTVRLRQWLSALGESFWLVPATLVVAGIVLAVTLLQVDRAGTVPSWLAQSMWMYNGGGTGARTLLGAIASSAIGVAGTVFSITIAALSLAAGQMGPRLLRNFTSDRGVQLTLGAFLGTFSYALMVLRSVRTQEEGAFTPHVSLTIGIVLAFACVGTLVYFVSHMASRINVDTVVNLVSEDIRSAMAALTVDTPQTPPPPSDFWSDAVPVIDARRGYLHHFDGQSLADWAEQHDTSIRLLVGQGDYVFPGAAIAVMTVAVPGAQEAIEEATALGETRGRTGEAEYAVRQLVEVAVRALSSGINDPHTAISVIDRLGAALCDVAQHHLPTGVLVRKNGVALVAPTTSYPTLVNVMFHMIRQNATHSTAVLIRLLNVLTSVVTCETDPVRREVLSHHADLVWADAQRDIGNTSDLADVSTRYQTFRRTVQGIMDGASGIHGSGTS